MSRGEGKVQNAILGQLQRFGGTATENQLCWGVADELDGVDWGKPLASLPTGELRKSFYSAFRRALGGLYERRQAGRDARKLRSTAELIELYPTRTKNVAIRSLREQLLPPLLDIAISTGARTTSGEREEQLLDQLDDDRRGACADAWRVIEPALLAELAHAPTQEARDALLRLVAKCSRYFSVDSTLSYTRDTHVSASLVEGAALGGIIEIAAPFIPSEHCAALRVLYAQAIPVERFEHIGLKDLLFRIAHFDQSGYHKGPALKQDTKISLLRRQPELVTQLPGHRPEGPRRGMSQVGSSVTFDPILDRVIDRHVFDAFVFVHLL